jgi:hypothetical protein
MQVTFFFMIDLLFGLALSFGLTHWKRHPADKRATPSAAIMRTEIECLILNGTRRKEMNPTSQVKGR